MGMENKFSSYMEYEYQLCTLNFIPLLFNNYISLYPLKKIADLGCGEGGFLLAIHDAFPNLYCDGFEVDKEMIKKFPKVPMVNIYHRDILTLTDELSQYQLIILRDVVEHIPDYQKILYNIYHYTPIDTIVYITFTPFYSSFGGHQHNLVGFFSYIPYIHYLPRRLQNRLFKSIQKNLYKGKDEIAKDIQNIYQTKITIRKFEQIIHRLKFSILKKELYIIRPDYELKFNLKRLKLPSFIERFFIFDLISQGAEYWIKTTQ